MNFNDFKPARIENLSASEISAVEAALPAGCPDVWSSFAYSCFLALSKSPEVAKWTVSDIASLAVEQVYQLAHDLGGDTVYFPAGHKVSTDRKALEVIRLFTGNDHADVGKHLGITVSRVRQILRAHAEKSAANRRGRQP